MQAPIARNEPTTPSPFRLLILEDSATDSELEQRMLRRAGLVFTAQVVATEADFVAALSVFRPDIIIVDYRVPGFGGFEAARISKAECPDRPVILATGVLTDEAAAELLKTGISDYVLKDHLARLPAAMIAALRDAEATRERRCLQQANDELARILECAQDAVIGVDGDNVVNAWNASAEGIYGTCAADALGHPLRRILQAGYSRALHHALSQARESGKAMGLEMNYRAPAGKVLALSLVVSATRASDGTSKGASIIVRDNTHQKQLQLELHRTSEHRSHLLRQITRANASLRQEIEVRRAAEREAAHARQQAEQANGAKTSYLYSVSHEIRTPMTSIIGFADLLLDSPLSDEQVRKVRNLRQAATSLLAVINDILDISRVEAGRFKLESVPADLHGIIESVLVTVRPTADAKSLHLRWSCASDVPRWVQTDPTRLRQILLNLVSNALKFTRVGGVMVCVARSARPSAASLRFEVHDTGTGIPLEKQRHLFQEFYRVQGGGAPETEGSGLGLAISRRLVEVMGGTIGVTSQEGEGSTFWFKLPLPCATPVDPPDPAPRLGDRTAKGRILVAEDLPMNQVIIAEMLEKAGHSVQLADHGAMAVEAMRSDAFDLVLMDMEMPVMDGLQATRVIRSMEGEKRTPIVALTANAMADQISACREAGMDDFIAKPIDRNSLLRSVASWVGRSSPPASIRPETAATAARVDIFESLRRQFGEPNAHRFVAIVRAKLQEVAGLLRDSQDPSATAHALHDLVSVAGNVGLRELSAQARRLMDAFRQDSVDPALAAQVLASTEAALAMLGNDVRAERCADVTVDA